MRLGAAAAAVTVVTAVMCGFCTWVMTFYRWDHGVLVASVFMAAVGTAHAAGLASVGYGRI